MFPARPVSHSPCVFYEYTGGVGLLTLRKARSPSLPTTNGVTSGSRTLTLVPDDERSDLWVWIDLVPDPVS